MLNNIRITLDSCSLYLTIICDRLPGLPAWDGIGKLPQGNNFAQTEFKSNDSERETAMDRRIFITGLMGVGATAAIGFALPRQAAALVAIPPRTLSPSSGLPDLNAPDELNTHDILNTPDILDNPDPEATTPDPQSEGDVEFVSHRRRRRRVRRWRRRCRRHWFDGHWRRRCRRVPYWAWIWFSI